MEQTLSFDPAERSQVEVIAHNGKGLLATQPFRFAIDPVFGVLDKPRPRLHLLAVGIDRYLKSDWRLSNAVNDAKSVGEALTAVGGAFFGVSNVEVTDVLDEQATEAGISAAFEELAAKVQPQDVFVLYLSGHGRAIAGSGPGTGWFFLPQNLDLTKGQTSRTTPSARRCLRAGCARSTLPKVWSCSMPANPGLLRSGAAAARTWSRKRRSRNLPLRRAAAHLCRARWQGRL